MMSKLFYIQSFALCLLLVTVNAYSQFNGPYVGVGYGNQGIYIGNEYVGFGNQGYVNYNGYSNYGYGNYGGTTPVYGTTGYNNFGSYGYSNPDYRQLRNWSNADYSSYGTTGQGTNVIYQTTPYSSYSTTTNNYSCTVVPGHFDSVGNWVSANTVCLSQ